ncbi:LCP family protein [Ileibacterium valens]|uniref:Cell envelope-related transcriptional attenuator domain-containing protein n=2 Tax=Ileibacterium valens TaxID=1862668 RepID=A0A1U7NF99_9FIRM|nr:LCP family protein [Ileibacterium valens]OLU38847.1 hypothetical protein BO222_07675 [Ileibacterium valens]OLU42418.1 hypothetical protein BM735_02310 [Erysipelotrichaceae bacterium NYU-BL-F16]OLU42830.1 hypothetical protein BO224_01155 [Erysipelotrichaceae bacterium NYU-BL-E8]
MENNPFKPNSLQKKISKNSTKKKRDPANSKAQKSTWIQNLILLTGLIGLGSFVVSAEWLIMELSLSAFIPRTILIGLSIIFVLFAVFALYSIIGFKKKWLKILILIVSFLGTGINWAGFQMIESTENMLNLITAKTNTQQNLKSTDAHANPSDSSVNSAKSDSTFQIDHELIDFDSSISVVLSTYVLTSSEIEKPDQLNTQTVGIISSLDPEGYQNAIIQLEQSKARFQTMEFDSIYSLASALINGQVDAIIFPEQYHANLLDAANDQNQFNALTTMSTIIDQYIYTVPMPEQMKNPADPSRNITEDPFVVLISGSDTYGTIHSLSRSDVNMLVAVNPETKNILIVSIPRDTYTEITCKKNPSACMSISGLKDKLTHSGIYGIGSTESSIEDLLDIEINYTLRVNFSSLINVVDALGGIDITVEEGQEVERFYANGLPGVKAGQNHLDGERALGFARERHAYLDDDNQRIRNQQIVLEAILNQLFKPSSLFKYPDVIRALSTAFYTNMPIEQIRELIHFEISHFPNWKLSAFSCTGQGVTGYSPALNFNVSMSVVSKDQLEFARTLIEKVLNGEEIDLSEIPEFEEADFSEVYVAEESEYKIDKKVD